MAVELDLGKIIAIAIIALFGWALIAPQSLEQITGIKVSQLVGQTGTSAGTTTTQTAPTTQTSTAQQTTPTLPKYQLSTVNLYVMDKLNPKAGIPNIEVEVLEVPEVYTESDLEKIASDPMRVVVDEDTQTDSNGLAQFTAGRIFVGQPYLYSVRGQTTAYDVLKVMTIPVPSTEFKIDSYTFPEKIYTYYVGSFSDILPSSPTYSGFDSCDGSTNTCDFNVTGKSGIQYATVDINIGCADAGKALKKPVLVLRYADGYEMPEGSIISIYMTKKTGTDFGIPGTNLADYISTETPIELRGSIYDNGVYYMTVADSGTYTVKITFDADVLTSGKKLELVLDDLGDYRGKDVATRSTGASPAKLTIETIS